MDVNDETCLSLQHGNSSHIHDGEEGSNPGLPTSRIPESNIIKMVEQVHNEVRPSTDTITINQLQNDNDRSRKDSKLFSNTTLHQLQSDLVPGAHYVTPPRRITQEVYSSEEEEEEKNEVSELLNNGVDTEQEPSSVHAVLVDDDENSIDVKKFDTIPHAEPFENVTMQNDKIDEEIEISSRQMVTLRFMKGYWLIIPIAIFVIIVVIAVTILSLRLQMKQDYTKGVSEGKQTGNFNNGGMSNKTIGFGSVSKLTRHVVTMDFNLQCDEAMGAPGDFLLNIYCGAKDKIDGSRNVTQESKSEDIKCDQFSNNHLACRVPKKASKLWVVYSCGGSGVINDSTLTSLRVYPSTGISCLSDPYIFMELFWICIDSAEANDRTVDARLVSASCPVDNSTVYEARNICMDSASCYGKKTLLELRNDNNSMYKYGLECPQATINECPKFIRDQIPGFINRPT